jgi:hypothetical protein
MRKSVLIRRLGVASFAFFAIKGCLWLVLALIVTNGLIDAPMT